MIHDVTLPRLKLGLIGGNIRASRSPALHEAAGRINGVAATYDLLIPAEMGMSFDEVLAFCAAEGYRGVNVTYPFKEAVVPRVRVRDPHLARLGAVNTVVFGPEGPEGFNTDYTGFAAAYRARFGAVAPGRVALIGTGGVGRAIAFALVRLGARELRLVDRDASKLAALAGALAGEGAPLVTIHDTVEAAVADADGVVNATPVGMVGHEGTPVPATLWPGRRWAFDAVYTPVNTRFTQDAAAAGVDVLSGWELFFHQGIDAFAHFNGTPVADPGRLRAELLALPGD
ncbi:MAG: NAD(P)-binding domain-containing protein [Paracoccaceae bacterium]|nr:NAD(P)-binding domain-containing protein [Paracoccaceae bacterium]